MVDYHLDAVAVTFVLRDQYRAGCDRRYWLIKRELEVNSIIVGIVRRRVTCCDQVVIATVVAVANSIYAVCDASRPRQLKSGSCIDVTMRKQESRGQRKENRRAAQESNRDSFGRVTESPLKHLSGSPQ